MICYDVAVRTTIYLPDDLLADSKRFAAETGRTLTRLIEDSLREALARRHRLAEQRRPQLPTFGGGRLLPGVDLDDSAALLDLMEGSG
jgi:hypothetical protein